MSKSENFWDRLSNNYDKKAKDKTFDQILDRTPKYLRPDDTVLDFACATGLYSFEFASAVKEIHAFDTSSKMIASAKNIADQKGIETINFYTTDLFDDKFKEGTFDTIFAFNILLYFKDAREVLLRMNSLLKKDGLIITSTACLGERRTFIGALSQCMIFILKKIGVLPYLKFLKIDELEKSIKTAGFNIIESEVLIEKPALEYFIVAKK